jgi:hypothetical protein
MPTPNIRLMSRYERLVLWVIHHLEEHRSRIADRAWAKLELEQNKRDEDMAPEHP